MNTFDSEGFLVIDGFAEDARSVFLELMALTESAFNTPLTTLSLAEQLAFLRRTYIEQKDSLMSVYSLLDRTLSMIALSSSAKIKAALSGIVSYPVISSYPTWRLDVQANPGTRWFPWHQEKYNDRFSDLGVTFWMPMHDVSPDLPSSTLYIKPGSHRYGMLATGRDKFDVVDSRASEFPELGLELKLGQAVVMSNFLLHRSGVINDPNGVRLSIQLRYDDANDKKWKTNGWPANFKIVG